MMSESKMSSSQPKARGQKNTNEWQWQWQRRWFTTQDSRVGNNDTIFNYYYFQMTKHDVTNRLPASLTRKNIKIKRKKNLVETRMVKKKTFENFSSRSVFVSSPFLSSRPILQQV